MGMSLEMVESSDRRIFVKFARSFGTIKRKFKSGSIPCIGVFRAIFRAWHDDASTSGNTTEEEYHEFSFYRRPTSRDELQLYIHFSFLFPRFSVPYFFPYLSANLPLLREINHISPLVLSIPLSLLVHFCSIWLFICAFVISLHKRNWGVVSFAGRGQGSKGLYTFGILFISIAILNRSFEDLHIRGNIKVLQNFKHVISSRWSMFWKLMVFN